MKIEIKSRHDASILFSIEIGTLKLAVEAAVKSKADLRGADLRGADLGGADLRGADLRWADLGGADLGGADLRGADLGGADLRGADLRWEDLRGADLRGADLGGAVMAYRSDGYLFVGQRVEGAVRIMAGCHNLTIAGAREHWTRTRCGTLLGDESLALIDHIERMLCLAEKYGEAKP